MNLTTPVYSTHPIETVSRGQIIRHEGEDWVVARSEQTPSRPDLWSLALIGPGATRRSGSYITKPRRDPVTVCVY